MFKQKINNISKKELLLIISAGTIVIALGALVTAAVFLDRHYEDRIYPHVTIQALEVGGLTRDEAKTIVQTWYDQWWDRQLQYEIRDERDQIITSLSFYPLFVSEGASQSIEFVHFDLDGMVDAAMKQGKNKAFLQRVTQQIGYLSQPAVVDAIFDVDDILLHDVLSLELAQYETQPLPASYDWENSYTDPKILSEQHGNIFDYDRAIADTKAALAQMGNGPIAVARSASVPEVDSKLVKELVPEIESFKEQFPIPITYEDPVIGFERTWKLTWQRAYEAVSVYKNDDEAYLGLNEDELGSFWELIESAVNVEAQDAKFAVDEESLKVSQFQPSRKGYSLDRNASAAVFNNWLVAHEEEEEAYLAVNTIEPSVNTGEVNELGVTEVLGVGYSDFSGSPPNRVHNIRIGADKLNGLLIKPGEEFSLLAALRPFTISAGYLPELVIKGDKIEPEVGGGLCQIGSTTFRAAMKSGLPVTERRNHSLVVGYYNDPRNGNPGTDATIYDSSPDFRFMNDTGNYILFTTDMNAATGDLWFTLWGTSDGRKGNYTEPVVHRWVPAGATRYVETTDLAPGVQKCQGAHPGASTSFTYSVEKADGELEEKVFTSEYRALPTICLVGVDPEAEETDEETVLTDAETPTEQDNSSPIEEEEPKEQVDA